MLEQDRTVAAYRDAVLEAGVLTVLTASEASAYLRCLRALGPLSFLGLGVFHIDGGKGAIMAVPPKKDMLVIAAAALRGTGHKNAERRLRRAAARQGYPIGKN
jgi:hypothetical protein